MIIDIKYFCSDMVFQYSNCKILGCCACGFCHVAFNDSSSERKPSYWILMFFKLNMFLELMLMLNCTEECVFGVLEDHL